MHASFLDASYPSPCSVCAWIKKIRMDNALGGTALPRRETEGEAPHTLLLGLARRVVYSRQSP